VLSGSFPAGRPAWESVGARFVTDIEPFERRKLWLLNGAHSLLAYAGTLLGYETVSAAIGDPRLRRWVEQLWDEAVQNLPTEALELDAYRRDLLARFENSRIEHRLAQIATDGLTKLRVRVVEVARGERAAGRDAVGCARVIAAWAALLLSGRRLADAQFAAVAQALGDADPDAVRRLIALLDAGLSRDTGFVASVEAAVASFAAPVA
jgi:fructuronate reductase